MVCGVLPWLVLSIVTRGDAGLAWLPVSMLVAVLAAMLVPILGATGITGLWFSFVAAVAGPAALLAVRRFSLGASREVARSRAADHAHSPESVE
jgi:hypothetical protein